MIVLGLTGSIGMGKSVAAAALRRMGVPVHDADLSVHRLLGHGGEAVGYVEAAFPGTVETGVVDRGKLGSRVFGNAAALERLEAILHPMVGEQERTFLRTCRTRRRPLAVLDIPLLFETGGENRCDAVIVVSAPQFLQDQRVLKRPGMTRKRLDEIRARQMPDTEKRKRADYVVQTGLGKRASWAALRRIVRKLKRRKHRK